MSSSLTGLPQLLRSSVGTPGKARNEPNDVKIVQYLFNKLKAVVQHDIDEDGIVSAGLIRTISQFQTIHLKFHHPDGVIDPDGKSFKGLIAAAVKLPPQVSVNPFSLTRPLSSASVNLLHARVDNYLSKARCTAASEVIKQQAIMLPGITGATSLTEYDYQQAYETLNRKIDINIIKAFSIVESGGRTGFNEMNLPKIAFEGHWFRKLTKMKYDYTHPSLSYRYKKKAQAEWQKNNSDQRSSWNALKAAYALDANAAIQAASWGMFQTMGFNYTMCGYKSIEHFLCDMKASAGKHLEAFLIFCQKNVALNHAMVNKDFYGMAYHYNGSDFGNYDQQMKRMYESLNRGHA